MFHQIYFQPIVGGVMTQELRQTTKGAGEKVQDPQQILFYAFTFIYVVYLLYILNRQLWAVGLNGASLNGNVLQFFLKCALPICMHVNFSF